MPAAFVPSHSDPPSDSPSCSLLLSSGHERKDVVEYRRTTFLPSLLELRPRIQEWEREEGRPIAKPPVDGPPIVLVFHDESTFQANNGKPFSWVAEGKQPLLKKGPGQGIMVSGFICSSVGLLRTPSAGHVPDVGDINTPIRLDEDGKVVEAIQYICYGKNADGFWTGELMVKQVSLQLFSGLLYF